MPDRRQVLEFRRAAGFDRSVEWIPMITGLYSAATAMDVAAQRHEVAAENLANVQISGFKRRIIPQSTFDEMLRRASSAESPEDNPKSRHLGTASRDVQYDFTAGSLKQTERPLDFAISGDGFFQVNGPDGDLFTRNGSFYVNPDGQLVTIDQLPVMGTGGPITLPAGATSENIRVTADGRLYSGATEFGQLRLVEFQDLTQLQSQGATLFSATPEAGASDAAASVMQGFLETANVTSVHELVNLVAISREYEAAQKALNTIAESIQRRIGLR
jgi:flagellar basal-body rod protein FlgF